MQQMELFSLSPAPSQSAARTAFEKTSERLREAEERFIASGALEGKDVWKYWSALRLVGFCYEGYTIEEDGSRIYAFSDPKSPAALYDSCFPLGRYSGGPRSQCARTRCRLGTHPCQVRC